MPGPANFLDDIASDLATWVDDTAEKVALAFAPGRAPFSANITEDQKLQYYKTRLFNPDGSPNPQGREQELQRLGISGFSQVYKALLARYPELRVPTPPIEVPEEWPKVPPGGPGGSPPGPPGPPPPGPPMPMRAMASGGIVTQPTVALIGEAGPEAVVPLDNIEGGDEPSQILPPEFAQGAYGWSDIPGQERSTFGWREPGRPLQMPPGYLQNVSYQPQVYQPPDPGLTAHLGGANPAQPQPGEIQQYIDQAARARGIDPAVAMAVAYHEGGRDPRQPDQPAFTNPAVRGTFPTGSSWWPFQLHYGGPGYEQYGTTPGLGNEFTQKTGYQPGDPAAWRASVDYALDTALQRGWYPTFYGSQPAQVSQWQGLPQRRA